MINWLFKSYKKKNCLSFLFIDRFHSCHQKPSNRHYAAILVDQKCKQTGLRAHCKGPLKMVFRLIVGCASKSTREKDLKFFRVPSVVTNQGKKAEKLSKERRSLWISAISWDDLTEQILANDQVCDWHFVSGKGAKSWDRFNIDWIPTLNLGHGKTIVLLYLVLFRFCWVITTLRTKAI